MTSCLENGFAMKLKEQKMISITQEQFRVIQDFMSHMWHHFHTEEKADLSFWAEKLDEMKIPWAVQNNAAYLMEDRENGFRYFRQVLKTKGINVI